MKELSTASLLANVAVTQGIFAVVLIGSAVAFSIPPRALGLDTGVLTRQALLLGIALGVGLWVANQSSARALDVAGIEYDERLIVITVSLFRVDRTKWCGRTGKSLQ